MRNEGIARASPQGGGPTINDAGIDKEKLLQEVFVQVKETLRWLGSGYAVAKQATLDAPHLARGLARKFCSGGETESPNT